MKTLLLISFATFSLHAKEIIYSSIAPIEFLVSKIGGNTIQSKLLIPEGKNPHTFTPRLKLINQLHKSRLFFHVNAPFEKQIIKKIKLKTIIDLSVNIHKKDGHHHHKDPHIWLAPKNLIVMAKVIAENLNQLIAHKKKYFEKNLLNLKNEIIKIDRENRKTLAPFKGVKVLVFHPAFEYFLDTYGLKQISIEYHGKDATPKHLRNIIKIAKEQNIKVLFYQPQFDQKAAQSMARQIGGKVIPINPLASNILENLKIMTTTIARALKK